MNIELISKRFSTKNRLNFFIITVLIIGILFRFVNLDGKVYWIDETFTSLQISGYLQSEIKDNILDGREIGIDEIRLYQYPIADSNKTTLDTIHGIISFEPQHTPGYFILARYYLQAFGNSVTLIRSISAIAGVLSVLLVYLLSIELFKNKFVGLVAAALLSISPFHLIYSQEARPFSLWTMTILLSSLALLRAQRLKTLRSWFLYLITIIFGIYTFMFSLLVYLSHGLYIIVSEKFRFNRTVFLYLSISLIGMLAFFPWIIILIDSQDKLVNFASYPVNFIKLVSKIVINLGLLLADFGITREPFSIYIILFALLVTIGAFFLAYSVYWLIFNTRGNHRIFISALVFVPLVILVVTDIIQGNQRSLVSRYLIPSFLGFQIAFAYLLAVKITNHNQKPKLWRILVIVIFSISILSDTTFILSNKWPSKAISNLNLDVAVVVNSSKNPLIISDSFFIKIFSLSHELNPQTKYQLMVEPIDPLWKEFPTISQKHENIFAYDPSDTLLKTLQNRGYTSPIISNSQGDKILWQFYPNRK